jgi:hypothetical protein
VPNSICLFATLVQPQLVGQCAGGLTPPTNRVISYAISRLGPVHVLSRRRICGINAMVAASCRWHANINFDYATQILEMNANERTRI